MSIYKRVDPAILNSLINDYEKGINVVAELNKNRLELDRVNREFKETEEKLKESGIELSKSISEANNKKSEKESYETLIWDLI